MSLDEYQEKFKQLEENIQEFEENKLRKKAEIEKEQEVKELNEIFDMVDATLNEESHQAQIDYFLWKTFEFGAIDREKIIDKIKDKTNLTKKVLEERRNEIVEEAYDNQDKEENKEQKKEVDEQYLEHLREQAEGLAKRKDLLAQIQDTIKNGMGHKGDEEASLTGFLACIEGNILIITGESAGGKTDLANSTTGLLPKGSVKKIGASSKQALKHKLKDLEGEEQFDVLYVQEMRGAEDILQDLKLMSGDDQGFTFMLSEKTGEGNWESKEYKIPAKGFMTTSTRVELEEEFSTRAIRLSVDESKELTKEVVSSKLEEDGRFESDRVEDERTDIIPYFLDDVIDTEKPVYCPWSNIIKENIPDGAFDELRVRRDIDKFRMLYKMSAKIHQKQRPIVEDEDEKEHIVATPQDLANAVVLGKEMLRQTMSGIEPRLEEVLDVLKEMKKDDQEPVTANQVAKKLEKSSSTAYKYLRTLTNLGYVDNENPGKGNENEYVLREMETSEFLSGLIQTSVFSDCITETRECLNGSSSLKNGSIEKHTKNHLNHLIHPLPLQDKNRVRNETGQIYKGSKLFFKNTSKQGDSESETNMNTPSPYTRGEVTTSQLSFENNGMGEEEVKQFLFRSVQTSNNSNSDKKDLEDFKGNNGKKSQKSEELEILEYFEENPKASALDLTNQFDMDFDEAKKRIDKMVREGKLHDLGVKGYRTDLS